MPQHPYRPNENPHTDPDRPYSSPRYQTRAEYHKGDEPFLFPWWAILVGFATWWPVGFGFIIYNNMVRKGRIRPNTARRTAAAAQPVYAQPAPKKTGKSRKAKKADTSGGAVAALTVLGIVLIVLGVAMLPEGLLWLPEALAEGGSYWGWVLEGLLSGGLFAVGGVGCLLGAKKVKTRRRMRNKIANIVGSAKHMYIEDIAASIPCSYEECCRHLENCIDKDVFGDDAYLDMRTRCLVVKGEAPAPKAPPAPAPKPAEKDKYQQILEELRRVNDAIPDEEMSDKISRLETVSARIFDQARDNPDKLPQMRKFMDYYLPTALKLLKTYAELDAQGIRGANITESKTRIENAMDTLVVAFENQLDQLFQADALDVSTDIDVMENMLRADGLSGDDPFKMGAAPELRL